MAQIRTAQKSEIPAIADIAATAFWNHPGVARYYPKRTKYPRDFVMGYERMLEEYIYEPRARLFVAVHEGPGSGENATEATIVGFAAWGRYGDTRSAKEWKKRPLTTALRLAVLKMREFVTIDRSYLGPLERRKLSREEKEEDVGDVKVDEDKDDHWFLHVLGVHPDWQGKGVGSVLLTWGVNEAKRDNVPILLWASVGVDGFYRERGFIPIQKSIRDGEDEDYLMARLPAGKT